MLEAGVLKNPPMTNQREPARLLRCMVTGASGFIGAALVKRLGSRGHAVLAVVRPGTNMARLADASPQVEYAYASLDSLLSIEAQVSNFAPDVVFHLAWWGGNSKRFVNEIDQVLINVPGTLHTAHLARESGAKTFIYFGSCVEYGTYCVPVRESDPAIPKNLYGAAKYVGMQSAEGFCRLSDIRFCSVRPFWTYGPGDDRARMIPGLIEKLLDGQRPELTRGEQLWDFLYIEDAVEAVVGLAEESAASGIFNLASGTAVPLCEVMQHVRDLIDPKLELGLGEVPYAPDQIMHLQGDITRLRQAIGWEPSVSLAEGLRRTVAWHRAQRAIF